MRIRRSRARWFLRMVLRAAMWFRRRLCVLVTGLRVRVAGLRRCLVRFRLCLRARGVRDDDSEAAAVRDRR